ncbi:unnamed protein product [Sphenostylis stenocarpa]|uniref:Uncharacterized protein n=1 Tax=Sphenostylis stenocarpa TaxID=92480 RepID=A0AA86S4F7_9FABA|nr:unnamed protein product [Sphenostylis stenocarpa]
MAMIDVMIEVALLSGREVEAERVQMIEKSMKVESLGVAKEEVGEVMEVVVEVKKVKVGEKGVNLVAMEENPQEYQVSLQICLKQDPKSYLSPEAENPFQKDCSAVEIQWRLSLGVTADVSESTIMRVASAGDALLGKSLSSSSSNTREDKKPGS